MIDSWALSSLGHAVLVSQVLNIPDDQMKAMVCKILWPNFVALLKIAETILRFDLKAVQTIIGKIINKKSRVALQRFIIVPPQLVGQPIWISEPVAKLCWYHVLSMCRRFAQVLSLLEKWLTNIQVHFDFRLKYCQTNKRVRQGSILVLRFHGGLSRKTKTRADHSSQSN